jgi:putative ABC transport system permease protein
LYRDLVDRIRQIPEVRAASVAFLPPFSSDTETRLQFRAESSPTDLAAGLNSVRAGFFDTLGISFVAGRDFTQTELDSPEPATQGPIILPESIAHRIFGTSDIVGRSVVTSTGIRRPVVGVIRDSRQRQLTSADAADEVFQPYRPNYKTPFVTVIVSIAAPTIEIWPELRRALADIDPSLTMFDERRGDEGIRMEFGQEILAMRVALVFGILAVMLAAAGLYATLFRSLAERRREYGIRVALGATPTQLVGLVTHEAGAVLLVGVGAGALVSVWLTRFLSSWLYGITPLDGSSFAGAALLVTLVMFLASLPACGRVARVNAAATLRE